MNPTLLHGQFRLPARQLPNSLWAVTLGVWTIIAFFHYVQFYLEHLNYKQTFLWFQTLVEFVVNYYSWIPIGACVVWAGRRYRISKGNWLSPLMVHSVNCLLLVCIHLWIIATMLRLMKPDAFPHYDLWELYRYALLKLFHFEFLIYWVVLGLSYGFEHYSAGKKTELRNTTTSPDYLRKLVVKNNGNTVLLKTAQIDWLEAADNYINIHVGERSYLLREKMHILANKLDPDSFRRIHRSTIINLSRVKEIVRVRKGAYAVVLQNGRRLAVSRRRREQLGHLLATMP